MHKACLQLQCHLQLVLLMLILGVFDQEIVVELNKEMQWFFPTQKFVFLLFKGVKKAIVMLL